MAIFLNRRTAHIHQYVCVYILDAGINLTAKSIHPHILQSHGIQHSSRCLGHAGIGVTLTAFARGAFHHYAAQTRDIHKISKLLPIAERARSSHHRVFQQEVMYSCL